MKILVITDRYLPEISAPSFRFSEMARYWIEAGHEVTVVTCFPNAPKGKVFSGYKNKLYGEEIIDGVRIIRLWSYMAENNGFIKRTLDFLSFSFMSILLCWKFPDFDICVATSPQFFVALSGFLVSRIKKRPWVFDVRDIWPESIYAVGYKKGFFLKKIEKLERYLYRKADYITTTTSAQRENIHKKNIPLSKIDVITNGVELDLIDKTEHTGTIRNKLGIRDDVLLVGYVGTIGMAHGLDVLLEVADRMREDKKIKFIIIGEGAEKDNLHRKAGQMGLTNLIFHKQVMRKDVFSYIESLDIGFIHLKAMPAFEDAIPSKLFEFMACGLPIIHAVNGVSAKLVGDANCGIVVPSEDVNRIVDSVYMYAQDASLRKIHCDNSLKLVKKFYNRKVLASNFISIIEKLVNTDLMYKKV